MFLHQLWSVVIKPMFQHSSGTTMGSSISKRPQLFEPSSHLLLAPRQSALLTQASSVSEQYLSLLLLFALTNARCVPLALT